MQVACACTVFFAYSGLHGMSDLLWNGLWPRRDPRPDSGRLPGSVLSRIFLYNERGASSTAVPIPTVQAIQKGLLLL